MTTTAYTALSRRRAAKMDRESVQNDNSHCAGHFQYSNTKVSGKGGSGLQTCSVRGGPFPKRTATTGNARRNRYGNGKVHPLLQLTLSKLQAYGVLRPT